MMVTMAEVQEALIDLLKSLGVSKNNAVAVGLMLKDSEEMTEDFLLWVYDNKPTEEQIMRKAIEMYRSLKAESKSK